ncbi:hypothetical protein CAPTEDRAFT_140557 [Capitella teleta]|uniref:Presequence protease, mitochondrial n=1 Tax=Capitella teleta TaxID=283909 RepID=R7UP42_CAPTE|nr:hypothetical protein CAPTEDRAFT_140557 [Capitella teleta]|eukprot:ELU05156.1 hypothetical protein CAPTEDRAFT_140557 [Capitella teleta]
MAEFELQYSGKVNDVIPVKKYKSKQTGLRVVVANIGGPIVNGYLCLATEAFDDDGLPHTLEHLVFMGSEKYPFKGVLDHLANRCLASGTNAWTDTDHTCYTMTTAGSEGFLNLLPIYLDHVLYPTLTEAGYLTEVHHINGEGEDAGVVYCEMQARENTGESLTHLQMLREMYPGKCGYSSETGGILANLRDSTSHKKVVCDYHREFYRAENLYLIITGMVEPEQVFKAIEGFEKKIMSKGSLPPYQRPWESAVPPFPASKETKVVFPSDDEEHGMVTVAWRGPVAKDQFSLSALNILLEYLTDSAISPLQRDFVEIADPFCTAVKYSIIENSETCVSISFVNVPKGKLGLIKEKLFALLAKITDSDEKLDMTRMGQVIERRILEALNSLEDHPHDNIAFHVIGEFLYGNTKEDMDVRLNQVNVFRKLLKEGAAFWIDLLKKYIVGSKNLTIVGDPSKKKMEDMGTAEKERVKKQIEKLGKDGLKIKEKCLEEATAANEVEPPTDVLLSVPVPSVDSIHFHTIQQSSNHSPTSDTNAKFPLKDLPVTFQLDDIQTNFVTMTVLMDTGSLDAKSRFYLQLYTELILESPLMKNGKLIPHQEVIQQLNADTVHNGASVGLHGGRFSCGEFSSQVVLTLKVQMEKYKDGVQWLSDLLYHVEFTAQRVKIMGQKMANDVSRMKRKGQLIVKCLSREMLFTKESNICTSNMLRQHKFLTSVIDQIDSDDSECIEQLKNLRDNITKPNNIRIHVAADVSRLAEKYPKVVDSLIKGNSPSGLIAGVGSVESAFLIQTAECISDYEHADIPALMTFIQYLIQLEGPMWRQIRGLGLSYHYNMYINIESGLIYFILYKSTHVVNAYKQAKTIIDDYLSGKTPLTEVELDACKSSLMFEIIEQEKTPSSASVRSLLSYLEGTSHTYNRTLIQKVSKVTLADLKRVGEKYFRPLFEASSSKCAICCHPTKVSENVKEFKL